VPRPIAAVLEFIARIATDVRTARITAGVWVAIVIACCFVALKVGIGESRPGTPILYPDHQFNRSTGVIASKFYGADELTVVVETELEGGVHRPEVMADIEAFQRYMEEDPKVGGTVSIVDFMKQINRVYHNADPRWSSVPYRAEEIGGLLYLYEASAPDPRVLQPVRDQTAQTAAVRIFYADHQGETIRHALERARAFMAARPGGPIAIRTVTPEGDFLADLHWWLGPLIPPRRPELTVLMRGDDGSYAAQAVQEPGRTEPAPADSTKRIMTLPRITKPLHKNLVTAGYDSVQKLADADIEELAKVDGFDLVTAYALIQAAELDRRSYRVVQEWEDEGAGVATQVRKRGLYEPYELWVRYQSDDWIHRESGEWATGTSWALASGLMGVLAASNDEVEGSNNATLIASFATTFLMILFAYRSLAAALLLIVSLGTATLISLAYMYFAGIGFDVNTLPVQALGVGVGVDYALYIMDRVVRERQRGFDREESIRIAIKTTGMAVFFTGTTLVGGIIFWYFLSSLRFSADMSLLLSIILTGNLIGAVLLVPSLATLFRPSFAVVGVPEKPALAAEGDRDEGTRPGPGAMPDPRRV
jgi:predicted RND superfamily exporter protein